MKEYHKLLPKNFEQASWHWLYMNTMSKNQHSIHRHLTCLKLHNVSNFDDVQNNVYVTLHTLFKAKKLVFDQERQIFTYIKKDGTKNKIKNFRAWTRTVSFNYLNKLRKERNKIEYTLDIDNCYVKNKVCTEILSEHLEFSEVREKVNMLTKLDKRIIELCFFEDHKFDEISEKLEREGLGIFTSVTLRKRKSRALEKLRKFFLSKS